MLLAVQSIRCSERKIGIGVEVHNINLVNHISIAAAMACRHVNKKVSSLAPVIDQLPEGFNITCEFAKTGDQQSGVLKALEWGQRDFLGIIGPASSLVAGPLSIVAAASGGMPVVSYWADSALLADNVQYPNFARTIPASDMEAYSTVSVIKELGWNNFAFIYSVARSEWFRALSEAAARVGIRLVTAQKYELGASDEETFRSIEQAVAAVANSGARIILEAVDYNEFPHLVRAAEAHNLTGRGYQWVSPNRQQATTVLARGDSLGVTEAQVHQFLRGQLTVALEPFGSPKAFQHYHEVERAEDQDELFSALLPDVQRFDLNTHYCLGICGYIYDAVVAMAVAAARAEAKGEGPGSKLDRHLVLAELADVRFSGASGPVSFDANLDREASGVPFSIFCQTEAPDAAEGNWKMLAVPIGSYVPGTGIAKLKDADFEWSSRERGWGKLLRADYRCSAGEGFSSESLRCEQCLPGTASPGNNAPCTPCPRGTHASDAGANQCEACEDDVYADAVGMAECIACPTHYHAVVRGEHGAVRSEDCKCEPGRLLHCSLEPYEAGLIGCGVLLLLLSGIVVLMVRRAKGVLDPEDEVVRKRVLYLRGLLWIDRANGFVAAGEWGSSSALRLRATHLESLARMTLMLDFEPAHVDALAALLQYMGAHHSEVHRTGSSSSDGSDQDWSSSARSPLNISTGRSKQYLALVQLLLDLCKRLLDPETPDDYFDSTADLPWALPQPSASERFRFLTEKVARLRVWEEHGNFLALKGLAQQIMDVQREACDELFSRLRQEEGGQELIALAGKAEVLGEWAGIVRQDHSMVQAIPIVETMKEQVSAHRMKSPKPASVTFDADFDSEDDTFMVSNDRNPSMNSGEVTIEIGAAHEVGRTRSFAHEQLLRHWLESDDSLHTLLLHKLRAPSRSPLSLMGSPLGAASSPCRRASAAPPAGGPPEELQTLSPRRQSSSESGRRASISRLGNVRPAHKEADAASVLKGFGDLQSALKGVAGSNARRTSARSRAVLLSQGFRDLQSALKGVARSNARSTSALRVDAGNIAQAGVLSDEEPFVQFLAGRAALLDDEFQAKIASLPFGEVRPSLAKGAASGPRVFPGPVKSKQRMLEKVLAYHAEQQREGGSPANHPLAAQILDPVRCSIVCRNPKHVVQIAQWLINEGPSVGLPVVRVKNKFSVPPSHAGEYDGYRDIMLSVVFRSEGGLKIIGEVQLHDQRMFDIKVKMHRLYKLKRAASAKTIF